MKRFVSLFLSLLMVSTLLVGIILPAAADDGLYTAKFEDATYQATRETADDMRVYYLTIESGAPAGVLLNEVTYTLDGKPFTGASEPGTYVITAHLPAGRFKDTNGKQVTTMTATLTLTKYDPNFAVIVFDGKGNETGAYAEAKTTEVPVNLLKKFAASKVLSFEIKDGSAEEKYLLRISVDSSLYAPKSKGLTDKSLYLYEDGKLVSPSEKGYKVVLMDGRFEISNVSGDAQMTVVIGAAKRVFPWWIIVIICIILLLVCMYLVGRAKIKREEAAKKAAEGTTPAEEKPAAPSDNTPKKE